MLHPNALVDVEKYFILTCFMAATKQQKWGSLGSPVGKHDRNTLFSQSDDGFFYRLLETTESKSNFEKDCLSECRKNDCWRFL